MDLRVRRIAGRPAGSSEMVSATGVSDEEKLARDEAIQRADERRSDGSRYEDDRRPARRGPYSFVIDRLDSRRGSYGVRAGGFHAG